MTDLIPLLATATAIVGTTGAGKSYCARGAVEQLLEQDRRVIIIDPTGVWWGLRSAPEGHFAADASADDGGGYPVVIFGGDHADIPITEHDGKAIADAMATRQVQAIIDVSEMTGGEQTRFLTDFFETLYAKNKGALHLVLDEADAMAPQNPMPDTRRLSGIVDKIARRGRVKGFRLLMLTQRPAVLHKNVLSQIGTLIALKLTSPQDRKAIEDWVSGNADAGQAKEVMKSLPQLDMGEGWVWSPAAGVLERQRFPKITTFDSGRSPKDGEVPLEPVMSWVDVDELGGALAAARPEKAPATLDYTISETDWKTAKVAAEIDKARQAGYDAGWEDGIARGKMLGLSLGLTKFRAALDALRIPDILSEDEGHKPSTPAPAETPAIPASSPSPRTSPGPLGHKSSTEAAKNKAQRQVLDQLAGVALTGPQVTILQSMAWWKHMGHDTPSRPQIAAIAGWKANSSHLKNRLSELSTKGLVEYPEPSRVRMTPAGIAAAPQPDVSRTMVDGIRAVLTGPQLAIFNALLPSRTAPLTRSSIARLCDWEPGSSHLKNRLSELSAMQIVTYPAPGVVALSDWIFEGAPA
jgi:hypothetical protein